MSARGEIERLFPENVRAEGGGRPGSEAAQLSGGGGLRGPDQLVTGDLVGKVTGREGLWTG